ncbi:HAMP domain-containing sensor histidine kinase [Hephaestia mangrovi]|uniref:HAMP domain-containing sensor histidine kinase n=1 Tax=Hephaestia mangrovi TaxID=2873268 RepID=UPI001CA72A82|nr:HAMP domain-containing sensor histidine kinase [Hephaestia mangrovi]MBY8827018.1 HAMP domain-containing histidine kinase [Hephaestia mangrovi]
MRLSFTARLAVLAITLALISSLASVFLIWNGIHNDAIAALRRDTVEQAQDFVSVYRSGGFPALREAINAARDPDDDTLILAVLDARGQRVMGVGPVTTAVQPLAGTPFSIAVPGHSAQWTGREAGFAIHRVGRYWLMTGRLLDDWEQEQRTIEHVVGLSILLAIVTGIATGLVVTRYVGRRLNRIADVVEAVSGGDFADRVETVAGGRDAFDRLAIRLNAMLDRIEQLVGELRAVTDSLAHDLRSPLARLRARAEQASLAEDAGAREAALSGLLVETDMMMRMLTTLLEIGRSAAMGRDRFVMAEPGAILEELTELYGPVVEEARMALTLDIAPDLPAMAVHRELLSQALANLIDNALRHAGSGGTLALSVSRGDGGVRFAVADRGPGIDPADREEAIRRFGRLDRARSQPGAGLGLSLVDAVARLHGGHLELADNAPGLRATIVIPA